MKINFDMSGLTEKLNKALDLDKAVLRPAYQYFRKETPIRTGYARRNTRLNGKTIEASYPSASKLDEGSSKQSPEGMTKPTEEYIEKLVNQYINRIGK